MMCGPYCMEFVARGLQLEGQTVQGLATAAGTNENGTRPWNIARVFHDLGHRAHVEQGLTLYRLKERMQEAFAIVIWTSVFDEDGNKGQAAGHYSVALEVRENSIQLYDPDVPGMGIRTLPIEVFKAHWYDFDVAPDGARQDLGCAAILIRKRANTLANKATVYQSEN